MTSPGDKQSPKEWWLENAWPHRRLSSATAKVHERRSVPIRERVRDCVEFVRIVWEELERHLADCQCELSLCLALLQNRHIVRPANFLHKLCEFFIFPIGFVEVLHSPEVRSREAVCTGKLLAEIIGQVSDETVPSFRSRISPPKTKRIANRAQTCCR